MTQISTIKRRGKIRVSTNGLDSDFATKSNFNNNLNLCNTIEFKESIQLNRLEELVILCDGKSMICLNLDISFKQTAYLSTEGSTIAVQAILFEKYWNERNSLKSQVIDHLIGCRITPRSVTLSTERAYHTELNPTELSTYLQ